MLSSLVFLLLSSHSLWGTQRLAFVVGLSGYDESIGRLPHAYDDAEAIGSALKNAGFKVDPLKDAVTDTIRLELSRFSQKVQQGDIVFVYFAGHAIQVGGENFLLGTDTTKFVVSATAGPKFGYPLADLLEVLAERKPKLLIVAIDACRNNPLSLLGEPGLARLDRRPPSPVSLYLAYAAAPGKVAGDGVFARHLVRALARANRSASELFAEVRLGVTTETGGFQIPDGLDLQREVIPLGVVPIATVRPKPVRISRRRNGLDEPVGIVTLLGCHQYSGSVLVSEYGKIRPFNPPTVSRLSAAARAPTGGYVLSAKTVCNAAFLTDKDARDHQAKIKAATLYDERGRPHEAIDSTYLNKSTPPLIATIQLTAGVIVHFDLYFPSSVSQIQKIVLTFEDAQVQFFDIGKPQPL